MFLGGCKDKYRVLRWLLQRLKKGIERRRREHMNLIDDKHRVCTNLRENAYLLDKVTDILYRVVRCSIELVDIERTILVKRTTRVALIARLGTYGVLTVDSLREDSRTSGFTHTARSAEEVGVSQLTTLDCIFQCRGDM